MRRFYFFLSVSLLTIFISSTIYADTTYTIRKGDNPFRLARKFKVSAKKIIQVNNLRPENLKPGTRIIIPSQKNILSHKEKLIRRQGKELGHGQQMLLNRTGPRTYTVRRGDNIYKIARRFDVDIDELRDINVLETDIIKPGQKILLEPELEPEEIKAYEAILSKTRNENGEKQVSESEELNVEGLSIKEKLTLFAEKLLNIPYRFGGSSLLGIDCSAFVQKVYSLIGINLPRSAREQFAEGDPVDKGELSIGDLVFFRTYASFPSHVGIYLGNNLFIHASSKSKKVTINSLETPYYLKRFIGAKRLINGKDEEVDLGRDG
jgi:peptidoglycan endopeptidase LytE